VAAKALNPDIKVLGVQATACSSAFEALRAGKPVRIEETKSIADAIMIPEVGKDDFLVLRDQVDGIVLVDDDQIAAAVLLLLERKRILAEGARVTPPPGCSPGLGQQDTHGKKCGAGYKRGQC
jgi:threonine dehydratase